MKKTLMAGFLGVGFLICGMTAQAENIAANAPVRAESGFYDNCAGNVVDGDVATECSIGTGWGSMAFFFSWDNWVNIGEITADLSTGDATKVTVDAYKVDGSYHKWLGNANSESGLTAHVAHLLEPGAVRAASHTGAHPSWTRRCPGARPSWRPSRGMGTRSSTHRRS